MNGEAPAPRPIDDSVAACPAWMRTSLWLAAVYNVVWGAAVVLLPKTTLGWIGMEGATAAFWQCLGMIIGVYGLGYAVAATDPLRHWPIVMVGWLGKIFGPIGYVTGLVRGELPLAMSWTILTNDLIWWIPFTAILLTAWRYHSGERKAGSG